MTMAYIGDVFPFLDNTFHFVCFWLTIQLETVRKKKGGEEGDILFYLNTITRYKGIFSSDSIQ
jgi:hypothetical protein